MLEEFGFEYERVTNDVVNQGPVAVAGSAFSRIHRRCRHARGDFAAEFVFSCELTEHGEAIERHGVTIVGPANLPASMAADASQMFAKTLQSFFGEFIVDGAITLDFENEVISGTVITHEGKVVHERTRQAMGEE